MKKFLLLTLLIPHLAFGAVAISWLATSTSQGWVFPQKINGVEQVITGTNFIATSTSNSVFPRFLFTLATGTSATTTNLGITSIASKLLKVDGNGTVLGATAGTDYENILTAGDGLTRTLNDFDCDTASGSVFGCLASADWTTFNDKVSATRALTIAGTANQITSSAGAQDLSADRTWTLSLPSLVVFPSNASSTQFTTTGATYLATAGGNVGIGTASPSAPLDIVTATDRSIKFYSELEKMHMYVTHPYDAFEINLRTSSAFYFSGGAIRISGTDGIFSTSDYGYFSFSPAGIKALRAYSPAPAVNYLQVQGRDRK